MELRPCKLVSLDPTGFSSRTREHMYCANTSKPYCYSSVEIYCNAEFSLREYTLINGEFLCHVFYAVNFFFSLFQLFP